MPETELSMVVQSVDPGPFQCCCVVLDTLSSFSGPHLPHLLGGGENLWLGGLGIRMFNSPGVSDIQ